MGVIVKHPAWITPAGIMCIPTWYQREATATEIGDLCLLSKQIFGREKDSGVDRRPKKLKKSGSCTIVQVRS
jgi:hypothetical protein